ncbi:sulfurtransferase TusA family protein [Sphingomonas sp. ID0503]|uniref:sulfurtransferase TusA family protein n=1 Tax=Sphingomonas sp. ID0503 TaxID=3399691 RepID=UPI003AFA8A04
MVLTVDARGMRCPWPVLRLARAIRQEMPDSVRLLADDPRAAAEVAAFAAQQGWSVSAEGDTYELAPLTNR